MDKKERILDLSDRRISGFLNRGYGMMSDGVIMAKDYIAFENVYSEDVPYPMFAVDLKDYFTEENIDLQQIESIQLKVGLYDEGENEISLDGKCQKIAFVSEEFLDGYSGTDILPENDYKQMGSDTVSVLNLGGYTGYKEDGMTLSNATLEDGVGFNIQLTNGDFTDLRMLKIHMIKLVFKSEEAPDTAVEKPDSAASGKTQEPTAEKQTEEELTEIEEVVNGKWLADLSNTDIKGYINNGKGLTTSGVSQSQSGIVFEHACSDSVPFAMFAVDFSSYLNAKGLNIADIKSFEIVAILYNENGEEIDLGEEYQKCCFVTKKSLNGYSQSDLLTKGNYKEIGSQIQTVFDLTKYDVNETRKNFGKLEDGVGFNLQILNGDFKALRYLVISSLKFSII